jgi:hypothetical protein
LTAPVARRTWGPIPSRPRWRGEGRGEGRAGLVGGLTHRRVYALPLDGWPFEAGERDVAYPRLALLSEGGERWRDYAPPFGEVSF